MTKRAHPFSPEVRERAVRVVQDRQGEHSSRHAAIRSIASKIGCSKGVLRNWIKEAENSKGMRASPAPDERIKALKLRSCPPLDRSRPEGWIARRPPLKRLVREAAARNKVRRRVTVA